MTMLVYRLILYLYPPGFRRTYGREMQHCVRQMRHADAASRRVALRIIADLISSESAESRAHPDPTRDVWELAVWDPLDASLALSLPS